MRHDTSRPCPNATIIKKHLQDNAAFEGNLGKKAVSVLCDRKVCM